MKRILDPVKERVARKRGLRRARIGEYITSHHYFYDPAYSKWFRIRMWPWEKGEKVKLIDDIRRKLKV
jgi:hypothetical protein